MMSGSQLRQHSPRLVILLLVLSLFLVACERPLSDDGDVEIEVTGAPVEDPDVGGGIDAEPAPADEEPEAEEVPATEEPATEEEEDEGSAIPSDDPEGAVAPETDEEAVEETAAEVVEEVEEAVEEVEEAAEEELTEEAEPSEPGDAEGDSEVGGGVAETEEVEEEVVEETAEAEEAETETEAETGQLPATEQVHLVQPGENLFRIGLQYGVSWVVLADYNNLANPYNIEVGQEILIPPADGTGTPATEETTYVVQRGDTLARIGSNFGVSWVEIAEANDLQPPYRIYPGQVLIIPVGSE